MNESDIKAIALFSYFAFLDDNRAMDAASRTFVLAMGKIKKNKILKSDQAVVWASYKVWKEQNGQLLRGHPSPTDGNKWVLPKQFDLGPWKDFQKNATKDELLVVIWSKIIGINDEDISQALGITEGTVRYRLARALRKLGSMTQPARR